MHRVGRNEADLFDILSLHGLRRAVCTRLLAAGVAVEDVQEVAGHAGPSVTPNTR